MFTLKIAYETKEDNLKYIENLQRQYSICFKTIWKHSKKGLTQKEIKNKLSTYNNIDFIKGNSWFMASLFYDVKSLPQEDGICFKAKQLKRRDKNIITKEEWKKLKLLPLCSVGDRLKHANRFFRFKDISNLVFSPKKGINIPLKLKNIGKNRIKIIEKLVELQQNCVCPITYKVDQNYIYISLEESYVEKRECAFKENRIFAIDLNPSYIGYSVIDWKDTEKLKFDIVKTGVINFKDINDIHFKYNKQRNIPSTDNKRKHLNNKRRKEVFEASKYLVKQCKHYKCEYFTMEELSIKSKDNKRGKDYNATCNNIWYRDDIVNNIQKRCNQEGIKIQQVKPQYSSILGNILYRKLQLPDMVLASVEISRRCQEFVLQYIKENKKVEKTVIFPKLTNKVKELLHQSMEELGVEDTSYNLEDLQSIFSYLKQNHEIKYRVPLKLSACKTSQLRFKKHYFTCFNKF